jgi:hypothetical protein
MRFEPTFAPAKIGPGILNDEAMEFAISGTPPAAGTVADHVFS